MNISMKLRSLRMERGLSQTDVANKLGITQPTYARYENGKITPQYETRVKIAAILNVPLSELLETPEELEARNKQLTKESNISSLKNYIHHLENVKAETEKAIKASKNSEKDIPSDLAKVIESTERQLNEKREELLQLESAIVTNDIIRDKIVDKEWENLGIYYWALSTKRRNRLKEILQDMFNSEMYEKEQKKK